MTGLNPEVDTILEIAGIITDSELNEITTHEGYAIQHQLPALEAMDEWNTKHHSESGLWKSALDSKTTIQQAESDFIEFIKPHFEKGKAILAGNSIWQDRRFLTKHTPELESWFHYRMIDVSSLKTLQSLWHKSRKTFEKRNQHRALDDIRESVAELKWYRENGFGG